MQTTEERIKSIVGWASVAYALGFAVITLHTARLGFPVIQLLQPLYIWVGLPLCFPIFFTDKILILFKKRVNSLSTEMIESLSDVKATATEHDDMVVASLITSSIGLIFQIIPFGNKYYELYILNPVKASLSKLVIDPEKTTSKIATFILRVSGVYRAVKSFFGFIQLIQIAALIVILLWVYVWHVYPIIPQKFGGGAPLQVKIILKAEDLGDFALKAGYSATNSASSDEKTIMFEGQLLYTSTDDYYVKSVTGALLSLRKDATLGVVWNGAKESTVANKRVDSGLAKKRQAGHP